VSAPAWWRGRLLFYVVVTIPIAISVIATIAATFAVARSVVRPVTGCPMTARLSA
jgi:hypothetical protein